MAVKNRQRDKSRPFLCAVVLKHALFACCITIAGTGIPVTVCADEITPGKNYQLISEIIGKLLILRQTRHITTPVKASNRDSDMTPTDVYNHSYLLLEKLSRLANQSSKDPAEKIALPEKLPGRKIPADNFPLLQQARSITDKLLSQQSKKHLPVKNEPGSNDLVPVGSASGKTPPDVDKLVRKAILLAESLL